MIDVIRAWRDEEYYLSLTDRQRQALPAHPAALIDLSDDDLRVAFGGSGSTNTDCSHPAIGCPTVPANTCGICYTATGC